MKLEIGSVRAAARAFDEFTRATFLIEVLESRRLLAAAASFDPTFGNTGAATPLPASMSTTLNAYNHLTPSDNGQFYAIAYDGGACFPSGYTAFQLLRINADGSLDTTFGDGGGVRIQRYDPTTLFGYEHFDYDSLLVGGVFAQSDGKVLLSYRAVPPGSPDPWILARFNSDGSVDSTFGADGVIEMPVSDYTQNVPTTWEQADGKIDVLDASTWHDDGAPENVVMRQFNSDGTPDETFGTDGVSATSFTLAPDFSPPTPDQQAAQADADGWVVAGHTPGTTTWDTTTGGATSLPDGSSVVYLSEQACVPSSDDSGTTSSDQHQQRVVALTVDAQGQISTSAAADEQTIPGAYGPFYSIVVQSDGKAIIAAPSTDGVDVSRINPDGSTDTTFSAATLAIPNTTTSVTGMWVQSDGKVMIAVSDDSRELAGITRLNADGSPDTTFAGGQIVYGFGEGAAIGGVLTNADGSVIVSTDDAEVNPFGYWGGEESLVTSPKGAQLVRLTPQIGLADGFDAAAAETQIQAAIAQKAADEAAALAAQEAQYAADAAAAEAAQQAAADSNSDNSDDGSVLTIDDGSGDSTSGDDTNSTDNSTGNNSGDPSAYGYDATVDDTQFNGLFTAADGTTVWNPDGTAQVI